MSWSITFIGTPEKIAAALDAQSEKMSDQSKSEFDSALPHLKGLVYQNFGTVPPVLRLTAAGHGYVENGEQKQRSCSVTIEQTYAELV